MTFLLPRSRTEARPALFRLQVAALAAGALLCIACPRDPDRPPPPAAVESVQPPGEARLAEPPSAVSARLRFRIDPGALAADWLQVVVAGTELLPGTLTIEGDGHELVWRPTGPWPRNQVFDASLSPDIRATDGRRSGQRLQWRFLVAAAAATGLEFAPLGTLTTGVAPIEVATIATAGQDGLAAVWWSLEVPSRQEGAFRSGDPAAWTPASLLLDAGLPSTGRTLVAEPAQAWLFDPQRQVSFWHQRAGEALAVPLPAPRPYCLRLASGEAVVWSASSHRAGLDPASHTFDSLARTWLPTPAVSAFGPGIVDFHGVVPFDGQRAQQIVRVPGVGGTDRRLVALPMARDGVLGSAVELAEVGVDAIVGVVAADDGHAAVVVRDDFDGAATRA